MWKVRVDVSQSVRDAIMAHGPAALRAMNATTSGDLTFEDPAADLARFDRLPPELRFRVASNNTKISCASLEGHVAWCQQRGLGPSRTIAKINELEMNELAVFSGQYRGRYKTVMPHVAAEATIQRYGSPGPSRHPPKLLGRAIYLAASRPHRRRRR